MTYSEGELKPNNNLEFKKSFAEYLEKGMALKLIDKTSLVSPSNDIINSPNFDSSQYDLYVICGSKSRFLESIAFNKKYEDTFIKKNADILGNNCEAFPTFIDKETEMCYMFYNCRALENNNISLKDKATSEKEMVAQFFEEGDTIKIPSSIYIDFSWLSRRNLFDITIDERNKIFDVAKNIDKLYQKNTRMNKK